MSPLITGDRPPPMARFTINVLPNNRTKAIVFGGRIVTEKNKPTTVMTSILYDTS